MFNFFRRKKPNFEGVDFIQSIGKLEPQIGDLIVIKTNYRLSKKTADDIRERMRQAFGLGPDFKIIILEDGMDVGILRPPTGGDKQERP